MRIFVSALALAAVLAGCSGYNTSISTLQFNGQAIAFPADYQSEAAWVVTSYRGDLATAQVSRPQRTVGETAFDPQRWYSCIRGLPAPARKGLPNVETALAKLLGSAVGNYDTLLFFSAEGRRPSVRRGFDSRLCRDVAFEPITAAAPL